MGKKEKLTQLACLMEKLYKIDSELGGTAKKLNTAKGTSGEFENILNDAKERLFKVKSGQKEQDARFDKHGRDKEFILRETEMRNELTYCENLTKEMDKILTKQAKNKNIDKADIARRDKQYNTIKRELFKMMKNRGMSVPEDSSEGDNSNEHIQTVEQFKKNVIGSSRNADRSNMRLDANERELAALSDMKKRDEEQDVIIDRIYDKVDVLHTKAKDMGGKIDHVGIKVGELTVKVDTAQQQLDTQNQRLKDLLTKYRQPSKFCLDMTLLFFLIGLIGVGYTMLK